VLCEDPRSNRSTVLELAELVDVTIKAHFAHWKKRLGAAAAIATLKFRRQVMLSQLAQPMISGILMGGVYGFIAFGLSLIFGIMRIVNFAHGEFLMIGMYLSVIFWSIFHIDPFISVFVIGLIMFGCGYGFQRIFINPILRREKQREPISILLFTAGLMLFLQNIALLIMGGDPMSISSSYSSLMINVKNLVISVPRLIVFALSVVFSGVLYAFISRSDTGRAMRAVSQDRQAAKLMGINEYQMFALAMAIGLAIVGVAGTMLSTFFYVYPTIGAVFTLRSFVIVVLGGIGSIPGALLGGVIVGVVESVSAQFMPSAYAEVMIFIIFIFILLVKPAGLFGLERE